MCIYYNNYVAGQLAIIAILLLSNIKYNLLIFDTKFKLQLIMPACFYILLFPKLLATAYNQHISNHTHTN